MNKSIFLPLFVCFLSHLAMAQSSQNLSQDLSMKQALLVLEDWFASGLYIDQKSQRLKIRWYETQGGKSLFLENQTGTNQGRPHILLGEEKVRTHPESELIEASFTSRPDWEQVRIRQLHKGQYERYLSVQKTASGFNVLMRSGDLWDTAAPRVLFKNLKYRRRLVENERDSWQDLSTQVIPLTVYRLSQQSAPIEDLQRQVQRTNDLLSVCGVQIEIQKVLSPTAPPWLARWESLEFHRDRLSRHERHFFRHIAQSSYGLVLVDEIDWSHGKEGTRAIGYGQYIVDRNILEDQGDQQFFDKYMKGFFVLSPWTSKWTFAHEVGHAILGLGHENNPNNLMFPYHKSKRPHLRRDQCPKTWDI